MFLKKQIWKYFFNLSKIVHCPRLVNSIPNSVSQIGTFSLPFLLMKLTFGLSLLKTNILCIFCKSHILSSFCMGTFFLFFFLNKEKFSGFSNILYTIQGAAVKKLGQFCLIFIYSAKIF